MKNIALIFLFVSINFAQYTPDDYELIKTTFLREFNRDILGKYLRSDDKSKVKAALLSIAQSEDTTFVPLITKLSYQKYGSDIAFALGEIGECQASTDYIISKLQNGKTQYSVKLYEALGKIGTSEDLTECTDIYKVNKSDGYPLAIFNFNIRGIIDSTENDINLLLKNINLTNDSEKLFRSIFAIYRVAPDKVKPEDLGLILKSNLDNQIKLYTLGILRKAQSFPFAFDLVEKLLNSDEWNIGCEAARTVCFFPYKTAEQVNLFLNLLFDENPNVARVVAQSLVNLDIEDEKLEDRFLDALDLLPSNDFSKNVKGEILLALQNFYPDDTVEIINEHSEDLDKVYLYQLLGNYTYDPYYSFEKLTGMLDSANGYEKFLIHSNLANFFDSLKTDKDYAELILREYNNGTPLNIVLYNYVIDSSFVVNHSQELKNRIEKLVDTKLSDSNYN